MILPKGEFMRNLFRILVLAAVLALPNLATAAIGPDPLGTCRTFCLTSGSLPTAVTWSASQSDCCSSTGAPCPPGTTPRPASWNNNFCTGIFG